MEQTTKNIIILIMNVIIIVILLSGCIETAGEPEYGDIKGILSYAEVDDSCGCTLSCYTRITLNNINYHFGKPCHIVTSLKLNETYHFFYGAFRNMGCSGDYQYWDIYIIEIYDNNNNLIYP